MVAKKIKPVRVRIAPSPTGYLHIGTARTALFNYLFAKQNNGSFILRIEDTDLERSEKRFEEDIINSLQWLGLDWDEGPVAGKKTYKGKFKPYRQTERLDTYEKYINKLLEDHAAYYCFCTKEELENQRQAALAEGRAPKYSGKCRSLSAEEVKQNMAINQGHVIRFKVPEVTVSFKDLIRGEISFDATLIGDIVIAKDPRVPLYNFAVVVDDSEMEISHVIRGEDHIANTPKQILIQRALGLDQPEYAHLPLILDPDRSKMSKRYSATSINEYKEQGFLPEAMVNFMALLGWHPQGDKETFTIEELAKEFDLTRIQKAGAVFNIAKLKWVNGQYIKKLQPEQLMLRLGLPETKENLRVGAIVKDRLETLQDFAALTDFLFKLPEYEAGLLVWQTNTKEKTKENLESARKILSNIEEADYNKKYLDEVLMPTAIAQGKGDYLWPLRVAVSGQKASPGPFEIIEALGKEKTLERIQIAIDKLI
ncbi:MAG: glutamyl-tRNA synthetase [Parcubacteria group bacterium Gr01-1014_3]|nr:MAG: glutamyl-tRNA synthetase [Parcubacteria group bacterium Gr01-1014_3]